MPELTPKYLDDHMKVHTAETWATALAEQILKSSRDQVEKGGGSAKSAEIKATFTVTPFEPEFCVRICGNINGVYLCWHVG